MRIRYAIVLLPLITFAMGAQDTFEEIPLDTPACLMLLEVSPSWTAMDEVGTPCSDWNVGHGTGRSPLTLDIKLTGRRQGKVVAIDSAIIWLREPFFDEVLRVELRNSTNPPFPLQVELKRSSNMTCTEGQVRKSTGVYPYVAYLRSPGCEDKMVLIDQDTIQEFELDCENQ